MHRSSEAHVGGARCHGAALRIGGSGSRRRRTLPGPSRAKCQSIMKLVRERFHQPGLSFANTCFFSSCFRGPRRNSAPNPAAEAAPAASAAEFLVYADPLSLNHPPSDPGYLPPPGPGESRVTPASPRALQVPPSLILHPVRVTSHCNGCSRRRRRPPQTGMELTFAAITNENREAVPVHLDCASRGPPPELSYVLACGCDSAWAKSLSESA
jgi:hypothetical protein